jgi:hypothetical protein
MSKETCFCAKRPTYKYLQPHCECPLADLLCVCVCMKVCMYVYIYFRARVCARDLLQCQKRPTTVSKETYYSVKRDLLQCQKRPITEGMYVCKHIVASKSVSKRARQTDPQRATGPCCVCVCVCVCMCVCVCVPCWFQDPSI